MRNFSTSLVVLTLWCLCGCDHETEVEVPWKGAKGLEPATVEVEAPPPRPAVPGRAATVDGTAISRESFEAALGRSLASGVGERTARRTVLLALIEDELLRTHLASREVFVPDDVVEAALERRYVAFGGRAAYERHLGVRGRTFRDVRREVETDAALRRLLENEIEPSPESVARLYEELSGRDATEVRFLVSSAVFPQASSSELAAKAVRVKDDEDFERLARSGRPLLRRTWVPISALDPGLASTLDGVVAPGTAAPVETPRGQQVYRVHERAVEPTRHFQEVRETMRERATDLAFSRARRELLDDLRSRAEIQIADEFVDEAQPSQ